MHLLRPLESGQCEYIDSTSTMSKRRKIFAHPGFSLSTTVQRQLQTTTRHFRAMFRPGAPVLDAVQAQAALRTGLEAVEAVLDLHCGAKDVDSSATPLRRIRMDPPLIGAFAQLRYVLSYALMRGSLDNEPSMNWQQYRAYAHSESVLGLLTAILRQHRAAKAGGPVLLVVALES
jgi:hypothetical protein